MRLCVRDVACAMVLLCAGIASAQQVRIIEFPGTNYLGGPFVVTQGTNGNLFGDNAGNSVNYFEMTPSGQLGSLNFYTLEFFSASNLTLGTDGNFYGTGGQTQNRTDTQLLFQLSSTGAYTQLATFTALGGSPYGAPIQASDGNFYGTAGDGTESSGYVYKYVPSTGELSTLYNFGQEGTLIGGLFQASDGNLYGTTSAGGGYGNGSIFKLSLSGTLLFNYVFPNDGKFGFQPSSLIEANDGNFYGTTLYGGAAGNFNGPGVVFKMSPQGHLSVVYNLRQTEGRFPEGLVQGTDGNFYGTTSLCGTYVLGCIFQVTADGAFKILYSFSPTEGQNPDGISLQHTNGLFYGALPEGGTGGAIYSLDMQLAPFITFVLPVGKVGETAQILGQNLTGTTSVTFNGVPATSFTVESDTYMTAVVPTGATTGNVVVTTPTGTLTSNVNFRISE
jgi:uncharacterized repeat protein (TIGR03803 family)